jgi:uncharacterized protein YhjY with autotransporter beta-barrel domain
MDLSTHKLPFTQHPLARRGLAHISLFSSLIALSSYAQAYRLDLVDASDEPYYNTALPVKEGSSANLSLRLSTDATLSENLVAGSQCTLKGSLRVIPTAIEGGTAPTSADFDLSTDFTINFTLAPNLAQRQNIPIQAKTDTLVEGDEVFRVTLDTQSLSVTCAGYGGPIPSVPYSGYGPLVTLQDVLATTPPITETPPVIIEEPPAESFDPAREKAKLIPQLETSVVLTMSGAAARNKTLAKQLGLARSSNRRQRLDLGYNGNYLPTLGGNAGDDYSPWGGFISADIEQGERQLEAQNSFDFDTNTYVAGVDYKLGDAWVLGAAISNSSASADQQNRPDATDLNQNALSLYSSFYQGGLYLDGILTWGNNDYDLLRSDAADQARASTQADEISLGLGSGYHWDFSGHQLKLFSRLDYTKADLDTYQETATGTMAAAQINGFAIQSLTANLGLAYNRAINTGWGVLTPEIGLDYEHQFKGDGLNVDGQFIGGKVGSFEISSYQKDANYLNGNLSLNATFTQGLSAYLSYSQQFARDNWDSQHYALGARLEF